MVSMPFDVTNLCNGADRDERLATSELLIRCKEHICRCFLLSEQGGIRHIAPRDMKNPELVHKQSAAQYLPLYLRHTHTPAMRAIYSPQDGASFSCRFT